MGAKLKWVNEEDKIAYKKMHQQAIFEELERISKGSPEKEIIDCSTKSVKSLFVPETIEFTTEALKISSSEHQKLLIPDLPPPLPICTSRYYEINRQSLIKLAWCKNAVNDYHRHADQITNEDTDLSEIKRLIHKYEHSTNRIIHWVGCQPSFYAVRESFIDLNDLIDNNKHRVGNAVRKVFENAEREYNKLNQIYNEVVTNRKRFNNSDPGINGVDNLKSSHEAFMRQYYKCKSFKLLNWRTIFGVFMGDDYFAKLNKLAKEEASFGAITDLDRLRDEYYKFPSPRYPKIPLPNDFTQGINTEHFSFNQLNTGDYNWALIRDILLLKVEECYSIMKNMGVPIQLNSVYRNPYRNHRIGGSTNSRHMFGDAIDFQVFDNDNDGGKAGDGNIRDDWRKLKRNLKKTNPNYIEPLSESGPGHVHVDYRNY